MPANSQIWFEQLNHFFTFNHLNANEVGKLFDKDFDLKQIVQSQTNTTVTKEEQNVSFIDDNAVDFTIFALVGVGILIVALLIKAVAYFREFLMKQVNKAIKEYFWNGHLD